jgi:hypothetical protein
VYEFNYFSRHFFNAMPLADDFEPVNTAQDGDMPDFEEHMEGEIEDLISDPEEDPKKNATKDDDWKPLSESDDDEVDSWAEDEEDDGIPSVKRIKSTVPK